MSQSALPTDLEALRDAVWADLARGRADRRSTLRTPTLATLGRDGRPTARMVVLRSIEPAAARFVFHTDGRSAKAEELAADPRAALTFWDAGKRTQHRFEGAAAIVASGPEVDAAWAASRDGARWSYGGAPSPGAVLAAPEDWAPPSDDGAARNAFRLLAFTATRLDWLALGETRHRRADLRWTESGAPNGGAWLAP